MAAEHHEPSGAEQLTIPGDGPHLLRRLVLVGAGRSHLHVLRALGRQLSRGVDIVVVTPDREYHSASMQSALLSGASPLAAARIDVAALAERAGARLIAARVPQIAVGERVLLTDGERIPFDVCSFDVDGEPEGAELPGVREHAVLLRPTTQLPSARQRIDAVLSSASRPLDCVIVGGGRRGVEAAFVLHRLLRGSKHRGIVTIVNDAPTILADEARCRALAYDALVRSGVCFVLGTRAIEVRDDHVALASGAMLPADLVLWATGGRAAGVIAASGLPCDERGRLRVGAGLRSVNGAPVFAAGDCMARISSGASESIDRRDQDLTLERALRAALDSAPSFAAPPPSRGLCLLDTGDGRALVRWGAYAGRSRIAGWLKRRRDRQFVASFAPR